MYNLTYLKISDITTTPRWFQNVVAIRVLTSWYLLQWSIYKKALCTKTHNTPPITKKFLAIVAWAPPLEFSSGTVASLVVPLWSFWMSSLDGRLSEGCGEDTSPEDSLFSLGVSGVADTVTASSVVCCAKIKHTSRSTTPTINSLAMSRWLYRGLTETGVLPPGCFWIRPRCFVRTTGMHAYSTPLGEDLKNNKNAVDLLMVVWMSHGGRRTEPRSRKARLLFRRRAGTRAVLQKDKMGITVNKMWETGKYDVCLIQLHIVGFLGVLEY